jgi:hypothetical protein
MSAEWGMAGVAVISALIYGTLLKIETILIEIRDHMRRTRE